MQWARDNFKYIEFFECFSLITDPVTERFIIREIIRNPKYKSVKGGGEEKDAVD
jgi:hypothetical protein